MTKIKLGKKDQEILEAASIMEIQVLTSNPSKLFHKSIKKLLGLGLITIEQPYRNKQIKVVKVLFKKV